MSIMHSLKALVVSPLSSTVSARLFATSSPRLPRSNTPSAQTCGYTPALIPNALPLIRSHLLSRTQIPTDKSTALLAALDTVPTLAATRATCIQSRDAALNMKKSVSAQYGAAMKAGDKEKAEGLIEESGRAAGVAEEMSKQLAVIDETINDIVIQLPNLLDDRVPDGASEDDNEEVDRFGDLYNLPERFNWSDDFVPEWHDVVATRLNGYHVDRATKMAGSRFACLSGSIARLERALGMYFVDTAVARGYTELSVPYVVSRTSLKNTGQLPKFEDDLFKIDSNSHTCNGEDAFLIPTAEVPVMNFHAGEIVREEELPLCYVAITPCFRAEAGSYGRDQRGLIRTHQFNKVELVKITTPSMSNDEHERLTLDAEHILKELELPYRKVRLCSGDIGFGSQHCYDLEVWMPGQQSWREISSCSNMGDFQARRMALRYRPRGPKAKPELCHSINGSGLAVGRALVAVLENYQMEDGSVFVPQVLRPYMGGLEVIPCHADTGVEFE